MSKYTTEVRYICETYAGYSESQGYNRIEDVIRKARPFVFDFDFPVFDGSYRPVLETKILKHYYLQEIGQETVGVWKHFLDMKLNEIMPYYNKLYETAAFQFNPLQDVDYYREHEGSGTGSTETSSESESGQGGTIRDAGSTTGTDGNTHWDYYSDTPQGGVSSLNDNTYLTNARKVTDSGTSGGTTDMTRTLNTTGSTETSGTTDVETTDQYIDHIHGKMGTTPFSKLVEDYRATLLNIDMMIINELQPLFMGLW